MASVMWFRRDLRLQDNPALVEAAEADRQVLGVFVLDPALRRTSGAPRLAVLYRTLRALDRQLGAKLVIRHGHPAAALSTLCAEVGADGVFAAADFGPYGRSRDESVAAALSVPLHLVGSPYAVPPGEIVNGTGGGYQVYSAFYRGWVERHRAEPARTVRPIWLNAHSDPIPDDPELSPVWNCPRSARQPPAGPGRSSWTVRWIGTRPSGTGPTWTARRACRCT